MNEKKSLWCPMTFGRVSDPESTYDGCLGYLCAWWDSPLECCGVISDSIARTVRWRWDGANEQYTVKVKGAKEWMGEENV